MDIHTSPTRSVDHTGGNAGNSWIVVISMIVLVGAAVLVGCGSDPTADEAWTWEAVPDDFGIRSQECMTEAGYTDNPLVDIQYKTLTDPEYQEAWEACVEALDPDAPWTVTTGAWQREWNRVLNKQDRQWVSCAQEEHGVAIEGGIPFTRDGLIDYYAIWLSLSDEAYQEYEKAIAECGGPATTPSVHLDTADEAWNWDGDFADLGTRSQECMVEAGYANPLQHIPLKTLTDTGYQEAWEACIEALDPDVPSIVVTGAWQRETYRLDNKQWMEWISCAEEEHGIAIEGGIPFTRDGTIDHYAIWLSLSDEAYEEYGMAIDECRGLPTTPTETFDTSTETFDTPRETFDVPLNFQDECLVHAHDGQSEHSHGDC